MFLATFCPSIAASYLAHTNIRQSLQFCSTSELASLPPLVCQSKFQRSHQFQAQTLSHSPASSARQPLNLHCRIHKAEVLPYPLVFLRLATVDQYAAGQDQYDSPGAGNEDLQAAAYIRLEERSIHISYME
jgi:hypothetical protein